MKQVSLTDKDRLYFQKQSNLSILSFWVISLPAEVTKMRRFATKPEPLLFIICQNVKWNLNVWGSLFECLNFGFLPLFSPPWVRARARKRTEGTWWVGAPCVGQASTRVISRSKAPPFHTPKGPEPNTGQGRLLAMLPRNAWSSFADFELASLGHCKMYCKFTLLKRNSKLVQQNSTFSSYKFTHLH